MHESPAGFPRVTAELVGVLALTLLVGFLHLRLLPWPFDDAFIHFRVAEHLADAGQPSFNLGEPVMASSAPGWTLLLAALFATGFRDPSIVAALNACFTVGGAVLWARVVEALARRRLASGGLIALAVGYVAIVHYASAGLMETPLALLLLGGGLLALEAGHSVAFVLLAVAPFFRLELGVFGILAFADNLRTRRIPLPRALGFALAGAAPFAVYELVFFGTLVPHTALAKARVYVLTLRESWLLLLQFALPGQALLPGMLAWIGPFLIVAAALVLAFVTPARSAGGAHAPRPAMASIAIVGALAIPLVYVATRGLVFPWYVPLFAAPLLLALTSLAVRARSATAIVLLAVGMGVPYGVDLLSSITAATGHPPAYRYFAVNARVAKYRELGQRLGRAYPDAELLSSEVGGLGWAFPGRVLDAAGLITPRALAFHPMRVPDERPAGFFGAIPAGFVEETRPGLIVSMDVFAGALMRRSVVNDYVLSREPIYVEADLQWVRSPVLWGSRWMNVLVRRDLASRRAAEVP